MRKAAVRHGDPTTTRGFVIAYSSTMHDNGRKLALHGDEATCGNCKGSFKIFGSGKGMSEKGRDVVVDGDLVLCPCEKNRAIASADAGVFLHSDHDSKVLNRAAESAGITATMAPLSAQCTEDENSEQNYPTPVPDSKSKPDCSYLDGSRTRIDAPAEFYRHVNTVDLGFATQTTFEFPGGGEGAASRYVATVNGRPVNIYMPAQTPLPGYGVPSQKEIAKALETIPPQQYKDLERVSINPVANAQDAIWQKKFNDPTFSSAATASIDQGIAFYPWKDVSTFPQEYVDSTMLHETGHLWSQALWSDPTQKQGWQDAITSDGQPPSRYAQNNMTEDFAESANMYWSSKGTSCEAEGRKRYPARYRYFDKISQ
ncbi:PAAR domain-containing protein [Burkholderia sp. Leaf177]|uniref:PAAR domain-containing protein n=1 Tax=Burkholderia sp. Leaf177 TaxID=1736287 RepID=UPI0009E73C43|nr:PAAR domain-containing protein [Burkholderia sp. Leaf177]